MEPLLGKNIDELQAIALSVGLPKFAGKQLAQWLYVKRVTTIDQMTNISLQGREALKGSFTVGRHAPVRVAESVDGTKKYLFEVAGGTPCGLSQVAGDSTPRFIESVYIPEEDRATLCVSTQVGCKMGCRFCMTGTLGFHGQLPASEILNQIFEIDSILHTPSAEGGPYSFSEAVHTPSAEGGPYSFSEAFRQRSGLTSDSVSGLTNVVYMGEGEPMDNIDEVLRSLTILTAPYGCAWSPKRITVSSVGIIPGLQRFLTESDCHLAISLHHPFATERANIMPAQKLYALEEVLALIKQFDFSHQRRVSFEYICWGGINDSPRHAKELIRLLRGLDCRVNLIRFHAGVDNDFPASDERRMEWFRDYLSDHGITTTIRKSRGEDILAACGMLVAKENG